MKTKLVCLLVACATAIPSFAAEIRINGASTTVNAVINPHKAAVEAATGITLKVVGTNTGKGLLALTDGQCDVSLTSEPLDISMIAAKFAGKELNVTDFQLHAVDQATISWVVNPSNPVQSLTRDQIKGIFTGKITNWKEVGGADLPIIVITDLVGAGTRTLIQSVVLNNEEFGPKVRPYENVRLIATGVSELKGAFTGIGTSFADPKLVKIIKSDLVVTRPLGFITKGAPSPDVKKIIDAFQAEVTKHGAK
jgi:phosphate transport system substrate-binding protein